MGKENNTAANSATDLTRRMLCGGLAGMIAKVSLSTGMCKPYKNDAAMNTPFNSHILIFKRINP